MWVATVRAASKPAGGPSRPHHDDRVELIDGEVVAMTPIGPRHNAAVNRANRAMVLAVGDKAIVQVQGSVRFHPAVAGHRENGHVDQREDSDEEERSSLGGVIEIDPRPGRRGDTRTRPAAL